jgi:hypothetical protein
MKSKNTLLKYALGGVAVASLAIFSFTNAAEHPFAPTSFDKGYQVAEAGESQMKGGMGMQGMGGNCGAMMKGMADKNKDGNISKDEFMKHHEEMFAMKDKNKDGTLDDSEMSQMGQGCGMMQHMPGMGGQQEMKTN